MYVEIVVSQRCGVVWTQRRWRNWSERERVNAIYCIAGGRFYGVSNWYR